MPTGRVRQRPPIEIAEASDPDRGELPFSPSDHALKDVLRRRYIKNVARWLLGPNYGTVLAQAGNSVWETALTIEFLAEAGDIFEEAGEELELRGEISRKFAPVARWIFSKRIAESPDEISWEHVTWDTCVAVRALLIALERTPEGFDSSERDQILQVVRYGVRWLCRRFNEWEALVKYPFGPADVAQIVIALIHLSRNHPELYREAARFHQESGGGEDVIVEIVQYLLHKKTEKTLTIETSGGPEDVISYWWDDHFSTAEVVEALAEFHHYCNSSPALVEQNRAVLRSTKEALVRACSYFEHDQIDGMWGSHVDTIKVVFAYVAIRHLVPQRESGGDDPLIVPEVHTTFKALRWMCDKKQVFADGSFLHTMFLTIFYARALAEVYKSWDPANDPIAKVYDDVVWFSPIRTTPERSKRLAAELENGALREELDRERRASSELRTSLGRSRKLRQKTMWIALTCIVGLVLVFGVGSILGVAKIRLNIENMQDYLTYLGVFLTVFFATITVLWRYDDEPERK